MINQERVSCNQVLKNKKDFLCFFWELRFHNFVLNAYINSVFTFLDFDISKLSQCSWRLDAVENLLEACIPDDKNFQTIMYNFLDDPIDRFLEIDNLVHIL